MAAHNHRPIRQRAIGRTLVALAVAVITGLLLSLRLSPIVAILGGWNAGGMTLLALAWSLIFNCDAKTTGEVAGPEDPGRGTVWLLDLLASLTSLGAAFYLAHHAHTLESAFERALLVGLSLSTVVLSWMVTHTTYTLRYAHLYYREDEEGVGGLELPGNKDTKPSYLDFAYFAFTLGMCFQVSDVTITSAQIRRSALGHAMLSFAYNTFILAFTLNLVFSSFG